MSQSQKEAAEYAEVLLAYSRGERIEMRSAENNTPWRNPTYPLWDFGRFEYRVAPKPVERWVWIHKNGGFGCDYGTKDQALEDYAGVDGRPVLMREVTE